LKGENDIGMPAFLLKGEHPGRIPASGRGWGWVFILTAETHPDIVDFVCFQARLIIEVDGGQHQGYASDRIRDAWREERGHRLLRFWNSQVLTESTAVLEKILATLPPLPRPSPSGGEG
jgi:hypothetical protein